MMREAMVAVEERPTEARSRVLVCDPIDPEGLELLEAHASVEVQTGLSEAELIEIIPDYDAMIVRSGTRVTAAVIEAGQRLQAIGRAGVGIDNIDVEAATRRGIIVVNAPTANTIAAAEHTIALMLALARQIPPADASLRQGRWDRKSYIGIEVYNKTLGVVGLGRIGTEVAKRAQGLGMEVIAYDPFVSAEHASRYNVRFTELEDLLREADFVTLHTPLTEATRGLIGERELALMKPTARLINCARGGLVDEEALLRALDEGRIAGAALDVFAQEPPPPDHPLLRHPKVVITPHLGGSTREAQISVAREIAQQILTVLEGRLPQHAVNAPMVPPETLNVLVPYFDLAERLGRFYRQVAPGHIKQVRIIYGGELAEIDTTPLKAAVVKGLLESVIEQRVNVVNAHLIARERGLSIVEEKRPEAEPFANLMTLEITADGRKRSITGTVIRDEPHIVRIDEYWIDFVPEGYLLVCHNEDQPGMIGKVGTILGRADVNIAFMQVGRVIPRSRAIMVLGLDDPIPDPVLEEIVRVPGLYNVTFVKM
jgi:D-3-phosphoglycerate dehydrogenase